MKIYYFLIYNLIFNNFLMKKIEEFLISCRTLKKNSLDKI